MTAPRQRTESAAPVFCARCTAELRPGDGNFYQVTIDAVADPAPPHADILPPPAELRLEIEQLLQQLHDLSEREALDQVHRRQIIHLCTACYSSWIEDPAG